MGGKERVTCTCKRQGITEKDEGQVEMKAKKERK